MFDFDGMYKFIFLLGAISALAVFGFFKLLTLFF